MFVINRPAMDHVVTEATGSNFDPSSSSVFDFNSLSRFTSSDSGFAGGAGVNFVHADNMQEFSSPSAAMPISFPNFHPGSAPGSLSSMLALSTGCLQAPGGATAMFGQNAPPMYHPYLPPGGMQNLLQAASSSTQFPFQNFSPIRAGFGPCFRPITVGDLSSGVSDVTNYSSGSILKPTDSESSQLLNSTSLLNDQVVLNISSLLSLPNTSTVSSVSSSSESGPVKTEHIIGHDDALTGHHPTNITAVKVNGDECNNETSSPQTLTTLVNVSTTSSQIQLDPFNITADYSLHKTLLQQSSSSGDFDDAEGTTGDTKMLLVLSDNLHPTSPSSSAIEDVNIDDGQCVVVDGVRRWKCLECPKFYSSKHNLMTHTLGHRGIKPHRCNTCGKLFKQVCAPV